MGESTGGGAGTGMSAAMDLSGEQRKRAGLSKLSVAKWRVASFDELPIVCAITMPPLINHPHGEGRIQVAWRGAEIF